MPDIKQENTPLIDMSAKPYNAYSSTYFADAADGLYQTVQHWYDAYNGGILGAQPIQRLLEISNCNHFHELMTALRIPQEYARDFRKNLMYFNGTLNDFILFYKENPDLFRTEEFFSTQASSRSKNDVPQNDNIPQEQKSPLRDWLRTSYHTIRDKLSDWFTFENANPTKFGSYAQKAKILAYRAEYFRQHHRIWRNVAISLPFLSLWAWGYRQVSNTPIPVNDNIAQNTTVTKNRMNMSSVPTLNTHLDWFDLSNTNLTFLNNLAHDASKTVNTVINGAAKILNNSTSLSLSKNNIFVPQDEYTAQLIAQKDKDLAEFSQLYRQCSYSNYLKLSDGYKSEAFRSANRSLKKHGIKPLHPRLYCAGMSIASLCQAQDIFRQKHPDSYLLPAIDEILNNCRNVHHCATLKKDLKKITNSYTYSTNPSYDIKNYMQTHKNAIVFFWSPRGGGNFHHQTFFPTKASDNFYTYTSFNRQRWGNQEDFQNFLGSKHNKWGYFTDFSEGLDNIATKYIQQDVEKHKLDIAQATMQSVYNFKQAVRS